MSNNIHIDKIDAIIFDFDGVLTDNRVYISETGEEMVACNRSDGLGFDVLKKLKKPTYILSTEKNKVVSMRGKKLGIPVIQNVSNKEIALEGLLNLEGFSIERLIYVGNDLNDLDVMTKCGYSACPSDSHEKIKEISTFVLKAKGGDGVVREILEALFKIDIIDIMYR